jgi:hypothetical protein
VLPRNGLYLIGEKERLRLPGPAVRVCGPGILVLPRRPGDVTFLHRLMQ